MARKLRHTTKENGERLFSEVVLRQFPDWKIGRESVRIGYKQRRNSTNLLMRLQQEMDAIPRECSRGWGRRHNHWSQVNGASLWWAHN